MIVIIDITLGFVRDSICGYINTKAYNISDMEVRELNIRKEAEDVVKTTLSWPKRILFNWVLFHARRGNHTHIDVPHPRVK